jgi:hypothetical protein
VGPRIQSRRAQGKNVVEARAALTQFDPRQVGVFKTSQFGPKLTGHVDEALKLVELRKPASD